jgi:ABC-2 type transport system permease protein
MTTSPEPLRTLRWATWLGWQIESNWADLRLFVLYLVLKPVCGSLVLVAMFFAARAAAGGTRVPAEFLPYMYVSSACYGLVGTVLFGMSYVVIQDRESFRMLKYVYISPARFQAYFLGRGLARGFEGVVGAGITLLAGLLVPVLRDSLHLENASLPWLLAYLGVGGVMLWSGGMILAAAMLNMTRSGMFLSEGVAGVVYLLSGVVFPLTVLPTPLRLAGECLPTTYWLEGMRRALTGPPTVPGPLAAWTNWELLGLLTVTTVGLTVASQLFYRRAVRRAWRSGRLEETSGV